MIRGLSAFFAILAGACLGMGWLQAASSPLAAYRTPLAGSFLILGLIWAITRTRWVSDFLFLLGAAGAVSGLLLGSPFLWMAGGAVAGLAAWDLYDFNLRLAEAVIPPDRAVLQRRHLGWLGATLALGGLLGGAALLISPGPDQFRMPFGLAAVLVIAGVLGLLQAVLWLRRAH